MSPKKFPSPTVVPQIEDEREVPAFDSEPKVMPVPDVSREEPDLSGLIIEEDIYRFEENEYN